MIENKNIAKGVLDNLFSENDLELLKLHNASAEDMWFGRRTDRTFIQFYFCFKGGGALLYNQGSYRLPLKEDYRLLLYNPTQDLPIEAILKPNSSLICLLMPIKNLHLLFSGEVEALFFLNEQNRMRKYYDESPMSPAMAVVLSQILNPPVHPTVRSLYLKGKIYELLGLYFNQNEETDKERCPFLKDEDGVRRIRRAKEIVLQRMLHPPTLEELSHEVGLNLKKLKQGFREVYGQSVFAFLLDHKMELARKMLEAGQSNVNEVSMKLGYSATSHFISAFKKKFGTTPKKYVMTRIAG